MGNKLCGCSAKVEKGKNLSTIYPIARQSLMNEHSSGTSPDREEDSTDGTENKIYNPESAISLRKKHSGGYGVSITPLLEDLDIQSGDKLYFELEGGQDMDEQPMLHYSLEDPDADTSNQSVVTVEQYGKEGTGRVTVPSVYVSEYSLGVDSETYTGDDPLIFLPYYQPGGSMFSLLAIGQISDLLRNPDNYRTNPVPKEAYFKFWAVDDLEEYTSYDSETDDEFSIRHAQELYSTLRDNSELQEELDESDLGMAPNVIIPDAWSPISETIYYRRPKRWERIPRQNLTHWSQQLPSALTETLLKNTGLHSGYDPFTIERDGERVEIHYVEPGSLATIATGIFGMSEGLAALLTEIHNRGGELLFREMFASRGETPPEDHYALSGDYHAILIPVGDAERFPDTKVAVDVNVQEYQLQNGIIEGDVDSKQLLSDDWEASLTEEKEEKDGETSAEEIEAVEESEEPSTDAAEEDRQMSLDEIGESETTTGREQKISLEDEDPNDMFWYVRPFDPEELVDLWNKGWDAQEIADELGVELPVVETSLMRLRR